jgi:hypothetical protein
MKRDDLSRSLVAFDQASSLVAVVELGSCLAAGLVPHLSWQPLKKLRSDPEAPAGAVLRFSNMNDFDRNSVGSSQYRSGVDPRFVAG